MASTGRGGQYTQISVNRSRATTDSVAVITLQRPRALNAITKTMLTELVTALSRCVLCGATCACLAPAATREGVAWCSYCVRRAPEQHRVSFAGVGAPCLS